MDANKLGFKISKDFQNLYACIGSYEVIDEKTLAIETKSYLKNLTTETLRVKGMKHCGQNYWGNEMFIDEKEHYYAVIDEQLFYVGLDPENDPISAVKTPVEKEESTPEQIMEAIQDSVDKGENYIKSSGLKYSGKDIKTSKDEGAVYITYKISL